MSQQSWVSLKIYRQKVEQSLMMRQVIVALVFYAVLGAGSFALAQYTPDGVVNALGLPYSPVVEHELQESDRRQLYGAPPEDPSITPLFSKPNPNAVISGPEERPRPRPSFAQPAIVGEIDETHLLGLCQPGAVIPDNALNAEDSGNAQEGGNNISDQGNLNSIEVREFCARWQARHQQPELPGQSAGYSQSPKSSTGTVNASPLSQKSVIDQKNATAVPAFNASDIILPPSSPLKTQQPVSTSSKSRAANRHNGSLDSIVSAEARQKKMAMAIQSVPQTVRIGGYIPAQKNEPIAFIDMTGSVVLPPTNYAQAANFSGGLVSVLTLPEPGSANADSSALAIDSLERPVDLLGFYYQRNLKSEQSVGQDSDFSIAPKSVTTIRNAKPLYGFLNALGKWQIPPQYYLAGDFHPIFKRSDSPVFARAQWLDEAGQEKWGYIDRTGYVVVPNRFDWAGDFSEGLAIVSLPVQDNAGKPIGQQYGYIDWQGNLKIPVRYEEAEPFSGGLAKVWDGRLNSRGWPQYVFVDSNAQAALESTYDWISSFSHGFARVGNLGDANDRQTKSTTPRQYGYIDQQGKLITDLVFENAWPFSIIHQEQSERGLMLALVKLKGEYGFIKTNGQLAFPQHFEWADEFSEGLAPVKSKGRFGYINAQGKLVIAPQFDWVGPFSEGMAPVGRQTELGMRYGFVDRQGKLVISTRYTWVKPFSGGLAQVKLDPGMAVAAKAAK